MIDQLTFSVSSIVANPNRIVLADFAELIDKNWARQQPAGQPITVFDTASSATSLSLAVGEGRNGSNAMQITQEGGGIVGFWLLRYQGGSLSRISGPDKFFADRADVNALEITLKFPIDYRREFSSRMPPIYPNHQNMHVGSYHAESAGNNVENNNWHYYWQLWLRHDLADDGWITIRCGINPGPSDQRSNRITTPPTNVFGQLTRFYFWSHPISSKFDAQIPYPFDWLIDEVVLLKSVQPEWSSVPNQPHKISTVDSRVERRWHKKVL